MKASTLMHAMESYKNGTFFTINFRTIVTPAASHKNAKIEKEISMQVRSGVTYSHMESVIEKRKNMPVREEDYRTPWWTWVPGFERIFKKHNKTGQVYITVIPRRVYGVKYYVDGVEVKRDEYCKYVTPSTANSNPTIMDIKVDNVISVR